MTERNIVLRWARSPLILLAISLIITIGASLLIGSVIAQFTGNMLEQMAFIMAGTGITTTVAAFALYRLGILHWFSSLRWTLALISLFTIAAITINLWIMASLMFVDDHYVSMTTILLLFAGLTAISFALFISRAMTDRLSQLAKAAERVAEGDLTTRLTVAGNDEISHLTQAFNTMALSLQQVDEQKRNLEQTRRDLIAWVSHDLRTPLTSMRVMLEALADGIIDDQATQTRYLANNLAEIEHLSHLIDDLFELSQLDVGHLNLQKQPTAIGDLISDTISVMMPKAEQRGLRLSGQVDPDIDMVHLAPDKIQRVLYNLVSNAIYYTPRGEQVSLYARRLDARNVCVEVHNSGVTIAADVLPHLFDSFYRGDQARAQEADGVRGTGLGLAIARGLIEAHGGTIGVTSTLQQGTTFRFTLPI